jgi:tetratricopeptide (TPR) repeat protein
MSRTIVLALISAIGLALQVAVSTEVRVESGPSAAATAPLQAVPPLDLSRLQRDVAAALRKARQGLDAHLAGNGMAAPDLAAVFGNTGLLYHAHMALEAAAVCYRNAAALQPADHRWAYYLGSVHHQAGRLTEATEAYERALELNPGLQVARLRLGRAYLELGELERAGPQLNAAGGVPGLRAAALFELGKLAYAQQDYAASRDLLLQALQVDPAATRMHYTLALAYRGLGDEDRAKRHLGLRGDGVPMVRDPLLEVLAGLSSGQRILFRSGINAAHRKDYAAAARFFADGVALAPENFNARVSLARFLYLNGDAAGARRELQAVLARWPQRVLARFLLAVLDESEGQEEAAMAGYQKVLDADPGHPGTHFQLAGRLFRGGDFAAAAAHYGRVLDRVPDNSAARLWQVLSGIRAGWSQREIRVLLEQGLAQDRDDPAVGYLLAALLAASPDQRLRDPARALELAGRLQARFPSAEHLELLAMSSAENGDFDAAVAQQKRALGTAYGHFRFEVLPRLRRNLERFEAGEPCREPWSLEDIDQARPPQNPFKTFAAYPPDAAY